MDTAPSPPPPSQTPRIGLRLTREGQCWLGIVALMLAVGILKNINLLALLGDALLVMLVLNGVFVGRRLRRLEARRVLEEHLHAGMSLALEVRVHNTSSRPIQSLRLDDLGPDHTVDWYLDAVAGHARRVLRGQIVLPRRGWYEFAPLLAVSTYPFGLWQRSVVIGPASRVLLLPRPGKIQRERLRHQLRGIDPGGERVHRYGLRHDAAQADFHGLRPFRPGDSPRWIHWRTSARRGEIMVREFEDTPGDDLVVVVERAGDPEAFEQVLSLAAAIVHEWNQHRGDRFVLAVVGSTPELLEGVTGPEHGRRLLECLALLPPLTTPGARPAAPVELLAAQIPHSAAVVVLAGSDDGFAAELEAGLARPVTLLTPEQLHQAGVYTPP